MDNRAHRLVKVRVIASARKERFEKTGSDTFAVSVREEAAQNMANLRVRELMAAHFKVPVKAVRIISGHHGKSKLMSVIK